jgi:Nif-specific regulatory protein
MAFAAQLDLDGLLALVVARCSAALDAAGAAVLLHDAERGELYFPHVSTADPVVAARLTGMRFPADRGIAGAVLRDGIPIRIDDAQVDPRFNPAIDRETGFTTRALLCVPLRGRAGPVGVLQVVNPRRAAAFEDDDLRFAEVLSGSIAVALENARLYEELRASEGRLREQVGALRRDLRVRDAAGGLVGGTPAMDEVLRLMARASASPIAVLIEGETGTGKELVARGIHHASARADGPFIAVNCAALAETLLESELFGHRRGAFTGALQDRRGIFEAASGGTIFLDEIGEMPLRMQAKLLRVLQEGAITPVGDHRLRPVDVRIVAATNRELSGEVAEGRFRADLYYRLAAFPIRVPPLRARRDDVPLLVEHFLRDAAARHGKTIRGVRPAALELLVRFGWPGNVRELRNEIERAVALAAPGEAIGPELLSAKLVSDAASDAAPPPVHDDGDAGAPLREARAAFEVRYVAAMLRRHRGNVSRTAQALGISRVALQKKMKLLGLREG